MQKTILITGASSGFGEAFAKKFAASGCALILAARSIDKLEQLKQELSASTRVYAARLDVTDEASIAAFFKDLPMAFQSIDLLVNNAGLALGMEPANKANLADWETMINTNITGLVRITHAVLPAMVARNSGHIINIGSIAGSWPYPGGNVYGASKAFVQSFSRGLRADLLGKNIRVSHIDPGMADTNFSTVRFKGNAEKADKTYENLEPLSAEDIADTVFWLFSAPAHVNVNTVEVMPVCQAWGPLAVDRTMLD